MRSTPMLTIIAFLLAGSAFFMPLFFPGIPDFGTAVHVSFGLSAVWGAAVAYGFVPVASEQAGYC